METGYSTKDYYYDLPKELIAQDPLEDRSSSRLMVLGKKSGHVSHHHFTEILDFLRPGDCLVINNTRVIPARLIGTKKDTGAHVEILLLRRKQNDDRLVQFHYDGIFEEILDRLGEMPLPPYITHKLKDRDRYNTVYAKFDGSAAAPTAGLHFTKELLEQVKEKGVNIAQVTLHVGLGTFRPVKVDDVRQHEMHTEWYRVTQETADLINNTKKNGGRIIAVGTTSVRTLETVADEDGHMKAQEGDTSIFIYPGYKWKIVDGLITNFHLPESTLIMLVSALAGREHVLAAYEEAVKEKYRFFSFGDAMYINPDD